MTDSVIWSVVRKESRQALRNGRLILGGGLLLLLGLASCLLGWMDYRSEVETAREGNREAREHWLAQEAKNPHTAAHYGVYIFKEPQPGTLFDPGVNAYSGGSVFVEAHYKNDAAFQPIRERTTLARFGNLNPAFFLIFLVPLVVIMLSYGSICGEKENGSLYAVATTGVSPRSWLVGKWLAACILPALALFGCLILSLILSGGQVKPIQWLVLSVGYLLYLGSVVNITLLVSTKSKTTTTALLVLCGWWILGSLAGPRIASNVAENVYPTPVGQNFHLAMKDEKKVGVGDHIDGVKKGALAQYGVEDTKDLPINFNAMSLQADEEFADVINDRHYAELYANQRKQNNIYRAFAVIWPAMPVRLQSMALAGSDLAAHHQFNKEAEAYRRHFVKFLNDDMMLNSKTGDWGYQAEAGLWAEVPEFAPATRPTSSVIRDAVPDLTLLALWFGVSGILLVASSKNLFRRAV